MPMTQQDKPDFKKIADELRQASAEARAAAAHDPANSDDLQRKPRHPGKNLLRRPRRVACRGMPDSTTPLSRDVPFISGLRELSSRYDGFILDLWGVLHNGFEPFPGVLD